MEIFNDTEPDVDDNGSKLVHRVHGLEYFNKYIRVRKMMTMIWHKHTRAYHSLKLRFYVLLGCIVGGLTACGGGQKADPLVASHPLAYVLKPVPANSNNFESALNPAPRTPNYGASLIMRDAAVLGAKETTIPPPNDPTGTPREWDVKDLEFSDDGSKLLFAAHLKPLSAMDTQTWNIWEYDLARGKAEPIISNSFLAPAGDDVTPHYLLDGAIIFASNRNATTRDIVLLGQGSAGFNPVAEGNGTQDSFKLHVIDRNRTTIKQVTFGTSHDLNPSLMRSGPYSGKIIFSRWNTKGTSDQSMNLYMINPDGTNEQYIYGWKSHQTGTVNDTVLFTKPVQLGSGKVLSIIRHNSDTYNGGDLVSIDIENFIDINTLTYKASKAGVTGTGQTSITAELGGTQLAPLINSQGKYRGKFSSVAPYYDGTDRAIVTYGPCYVVPLGSTTGAGEICTDKNIDGTPTPPPYYVGVYNFNSKVLELLIDKIPTKLVNGVEQRYYYADAAVAQDKAPPTYISSSGGSSLTTGILHIRNVLPSGVTSTNAPYIRIYKHAYINTTAAANANLIGPDNTVRRFKMRELIGYATVNMDGSVRARVPANVPLSFQLVNSNFETISGSSQSPDHPVWFTVRAGEERTCNGCHESVTPALPHGRFDAEQLVNTSNSSTEAQTATSGDPVTMNPRIDPTDLIPDVNSMIGASTNFPVNFSSKCLTQATWDGTCRITIDFSSIQSPGGVLDSGGALLPSLWSATYKNCISCHVPTTDINGNTVAPPGGFDLSITGEANAGDPTNYAAYTNLLTRITPGSASGSNFLYISPGVSRFGPGVLHPISGGVADRFTPGEIKMISEWIDNGAQYQNHP